MSILGLLVALILPAILGICWLQLVWRNSHPAARIGYGYFLGMFLVAIILQVWCRSGYPLDFSLISALLITLSLIPIFLGARLSAKRTKNVTYLPFDATWQKVVWGAILAVLVVRYSGILLEVIWRPLYAWDAWMNWAPKAKTWFELKELVAFVSPSDWVNANAKQTTYTLGNPSASIYPPLVPLIQAWTALGLGVWVDNLVNIPWVLCTLALGTAFYGQGRMLGVKAHIVMMVVFMLLSMPYLNVHTALSGYADIWLAALYCLAAMAFINWSLTKDRKQAVLMIVFALACLQTKVPGIIWAATLLPAILLSLLSSKWRYIFFGGALVVFVTGYYFGGFSFSVPKIGVFSITPEAIVVPLLGRFSIEYHQIGEAFVLNSLIWDNWNILGWLVIVLFIPLYVKNIRLPPLLAPNVLLFCGFFFIFITFFFTRHYLAAIDNTTINRASIPMISVLLYYFPLYFQLNKRRDVLVSINVEKEQAGV